MYLEVFNNLESLGVCRIVGTFVDLLANQQTVVAVLKHSSLSRKIPNGDQVHH